MLLRFLLRYSWSKGSDHHTTNDQSRGFPQRSSIPTLVLSLRHGVHAKETFDFLGTGEARPAAPETLFFSAIGADSRDNISRNGPSPEEGYRPREGVF